MTDAFPCIESGLELAPNVDLIEQYKWEEREDRVSSCAVAAELNAAILSGALSIDIARSVHEKVAALPALWVDLDLDGQERVKAFDNGRDIADIAYIMYGSGQRLPYRMVLATDYYLDSRQLVFGKTPASDDMKTTLEFLLGRNYSFVLGADKHATTITCLGSDVVEIDPRSPGQPKLTTVEELLHRSTCRKDVLAPLPVLRTCVVLDPIES